MILQSIVLILLFVMSVIFFCGCMKPSVNKGKSIDFKDWILVWFFRLISSLMFSIGVFIGFIMIGSMIGEFNLLAGILLSYAAFLRLRSMHEDDDVFAKIEDHIAKLRSRFFK